MKIEIMEAKKSKDWQMAIIDHLGQLPDFFSRKHHQLETASKSVFFSLYFNGVNGLMMTTMMHGFLYFCDEGLAILVTFPSLTHAYMKYSPFQR